MATIIITMEMMRQTTVTWDIDWRGTPSTETMDGNTGTIVNAAPRWIGEPTFVFGSALLGAFRARRWEGQGRANIFRVNLFDPAVYNPADPDATVPAAADAAAGDTTIQATITSAGDVPAVGQIMSHANWPTAVTSVTDLGSDVYELGVQPPLRAAIATSDDIRLMGRGLFQAVDDSTGRVSYGTNGVAKVKMKLVEVLSR